MYILKTEWYLYLNMSHNVSKCENVAAFYENVCIYPGLTPKLSSNFAWYCSV